MKRASGVKASSKAKPVEDAGDKTELRRATLAAEAKANPFRFFTSEDTGLICDLGSDVMTTLRGAGAPVVGRKMNPALLMEWLKEHHQDVPKVRSGEEGN